MWVGRYLVGVGLNEVLVAEHRVWLNGVIFAGQILPVFRVLIFVYFDGSMQM